MVHCNGSLKPISKLNAMMNVQSRTFARVKVVFDEYDFLVNGAGQNVDVQIQGWGGSRG
jgi:hypothetical protein